MKFSGLNKEKQNEVLCLFLFLSHHNNSSSVQRSQFEELQTAWRHQCAADIKGNSSSFKLSSLS